MSYFWYVLLSIAAVLAVHGQDSGSGTPPFLELRGGAGKHTDYSYGFRLNVCLRAPQGEFTKLFHDSGRATVLEMSYSSGTCEGPPQHIRYHALYSGMECLSDAGTPVTDGGFIAGLLRRGAALSMARAAPSLAAEREGVLTTSSGPGGEVMSYEYYSFLADCIPHSTGWSSFKLDVEDCTADSYKVLEYLDSACSGCATRRAAPTDSAASVSCLPPAVSRPSKDYISSSGASPPTPATARLLAGVGSEIFVTDISDGAASASLCNPETATSSSCNLRSAVEYCLTLFACTISLPRSGTLSFDSSLGSIVIDSVGTQVTINGRDSTVLSDGGSARFLTVLNTLAGFSLHIGNTTFDSFSSAGDGGVIYCEASSDIWLSNNAFSASDAVYGGAVGFYDCTDVVLKRCSFVSNFASFYGAGLLIEASKRVGILDCLFDSNEGNYRGGAIYVTGGQDIRMLGSVFTDNFAFTNGGALYVVGGAAALHIANCSFNRNYLTKSTDSYGGAIYLKQTEYSDIFDCDFSFNSAYYGGGIYMSELNKGVTYLRCLWESNEATLSAGAFFVWGSTRIFLNETIFSGNYAYEKAGGMYVSTDASYVYFVNSEWTGNYIVGAGDTYGGGVYVYGSESIFTFRCSFVDNIADYGGGHYLSSDNEGLLFRGCLWHANSAHVTGGAIYVISGYLITVDASTVQDNVAVDSAAGLYIGSGSFDMFLSDVTFARNEASGGGSGGALYLYLANDIYVHGCNFTSNFAGNGGALYITETNRMYFLSCRWHDNSASKDGGAVYMFDSSSIDFHSGEFDSNLAVGAVWSKGGAAYFDECSGVTLSGVNFLRNQARFGGGGVVLYEYNSFFEFKHCLFHRNIVNDDSPYYSLQYANYAGGGMYFHLYNDNHLISDTIFDSNWALFSGGGLALYEFNDDVTISGGCFENNVASAGHAGGMLCEQVQQNMVIDSTTFRRNRAQQNGGAIHIYHNNAKWRLTNLTFIENEALLGGAFHTLSTTYDFSVEESTFIGNVARSNGGVFYLTQSVSDFSIRNCKFENNTASGGSGGVMYAIQAIANLEYFGCNFSHNNATKNGGVLTAIGGNYLTFQKCRFNRNTAQNGGAIAVYVLNDIFVDRSVFVGNSAVGVGGGGVYALSDNNVYLSSTIFTGNVGDHGGGIAILSDNVEVEITNCVITDNTGNYGGGIYIGLWNQHVLITDSVVSHNHVLQAGGGVFLNSFSRADVTRCLLEHNTATTEGGGLYYEAEYLHLVDTNMTENYAADGGGIMSKGVNILLHGCAFVENMGRSGGAISLTFEESVLIRFSEFRGNIATVNGGAISCVETKEVVLQNCTMIDNVAENGGVVWSVLVYLVTLQSCVFLRNEAGGTDSGMGGALYLSGGSVVSIHDTIFNTNYGGIGGSVYLASQTFAEIVRSNFSGNEALWRDGSSIWASGSSVSLSGNVFHENNAQRGGGCVFWERNSGMLEPDGLRNDSSNLFSRNKGVYGVDWATDAASFRRTGSSAEYWVVEYEANLSPLALFLVDWYDQVMYSTSSGIVKLETVYPSKCGREDGYLTGGTLVYLRDGVANFTQIEMHCMPSGAMNINASFTSDAHSVVFTMPVRFRSCNRGEFFDGGRCIRCPAGTFSFADNSDNSVSSCHSCPDGASFCSGSDIKLNAGYWRLSNSTSTPIECPLVSDSCVGGSRAGIELCGSGYEGRLCAVCSKEYYYSTFANACYKCDGNGVSPAVLVSVLSLVVVLIGVGVYWYYTSFSHHLQIDHGDSLLIRVMNYFGVMKAYTTSEKAAFVALVVQKGKIYFTLFQILSTMVFVYDVKFPTVYKQTSSTVEPFNLNIPQLFGFACSIDYDYFDSLLGNTLVPIFFLCYFWVIKMIVDLTTRLSDLSSQIAADRLDQTFSKCLKLCVYFMFIVLPPICTSLFRVFNCVDTDPDNTTAGEELYMASDYSISCSSDRYKFGRAYAIVMVLVYAVGVPLSMFAYLYSVHSEILYRYNRKSDPSEERKRLHTLAPALFLYAAYEPKFWYWEIVETIRKIVFTGVLAVISQGSKLQAIVALFVSLFYVKLYGYYRPYIDDIIDAVAEFAMWQLFTIFFLILLLRDDEFKDGLPFYVIDVILVINFFASIFLELAYIVVTFFYRWFYGIKGNDINVMFGYIEAESNKYSMKGEIDIQQPVGSEPPPTPAYIPGSIGERTVSLGEKSGRIHPV